MNWLEWLMGVFVVYRLSADLTVAEGPFAIYETLRNLYLRNDWFGRGIRCPICVSFWVSLALAIALSFGSSFVDFALVWLSFAGASSFLWRLTHPNVV